MPDTTPPPRPPRSRLLTRACWCAVLLLALTLPARLLAGTSWMLDMLANFAPALAAAALLTALPVLLLRRWTAALTLLAIALTHLVWLASGRAPQANPGGAATLSVMSFNVRATNPRPDACAQLVATGPADVVVLIECPYRLATYLESSDAIRSAYPFRAMPEEAHEWNGAILSRYPLEHLALRDQLRAEGRRDELQRYRFQFLFQRSFIVHAPGGDAIVSGLWLTSPRSAARWRDGNQELRLAGEIIERYLRPRGLPILIACDLNATPSGWRSRELARAHGLRRSKPLSSPGSWPADRAAPARIAIDDVIVSAGVRVSEWRVLDDSAGSDHRPVVATLVLPK
ncbi:MAG: endonuclease/exonuclease/phosphatase family protein [Phycisphaerales bacterium]|nr:endonuclease/exonuclease/phosphatase family protein [Phycisphaerales bacterium]